MLNADNRLDGGTLVLIVDDGWTAAKNWASGRPRSAICWTRRNAGTDPVLLSPRRPADQVTKDRNSPSWRRTAAREVFAGHDAEALGD